MSEIEHDGWAIESSNPDAGAVTANLDATTPSPVDETAAPSAEGPAPAEAAPAESETVDATERERAPDGKFAKKGSIQERIDKAVGAQRAAERRAEELAQRVAQYEARAPQERPQEVAPAAPVHTEAGGWELPTPPDGRVSWSGRPEPDPNAFDTYELGVKAVARWEAAEVFAYESEQRQAAQQHQHALYSHTERIQSYAQQTPDYFEKIQAAARLPVAKVMEAAIIQSDRGPELAYFLATHPEEAIRLAQEHVKRPLSDAPFVRELLESKLTSQAAQSGPASGVSRSPVYRPIKPVGATPVVAETPPDDLEFGPEYVRRMNERDRQRRRF